MDPMNVAIALPVAKNFSTLKKINPFAGILSHYNQTDVEIKKELEAPFNFS